MIGLAHGLGLQVVAEGVESAVQLTQLRQWGCDVVRGAYVAPPLPSDALIALLNDGKAVASLAALACGGGGLKRSF